MVKACSTPVSGSIIGRPRRLVSSLAGQGYRGAGESLAKSLLEMGMAWRIINDGEMQFVYRMAHGEGFDRKTIQIDRSPQEIWPDAPWDALAKHAKVSVNDLVADCSIDELTHILFKHYGATCVFGPDYWVGFVIVDDTSGGYKAVRSAAPRNQAANQSSKGLVPARLKLGADFVKATEGFWNTRT